MIKYCFLAVISVRSILQSKKKDVFRFWMVTSTESKGSTDKRQYQSL